MGGLYQLCFVASLSMAVEALPDPSLHQGKCHLVRRLEDVNPAMCFSEPECGEQCTTVDDVQCQTRPVRQCRQVNQQKCTNVQEQECNVVTVPQCSVVQEQKCTT